MKLFRGAAIEAELAEQRRILAALSLKLDGLRAHLDQVLTLLTDEVASLKPLPAEPLLGPPEPRAKRRMPFHYPGIEDIDVPYAIDEMERR